jgi:hypothetical protein
VQPLVGCGYLRGIGRSRQDHGNEIVGVESNGGGHLLEAVGAEGLRRLIWLREALRGIVVGLLSVVWLLSVGWRLLVLGLLILGLLVLRLAILRIG